MEYRRYDLVLRDDHEATRYLASAGLFGSRLDLMTFGEGGRNNVQTEVEYGREPERKNLDKQRPNELDSLRRVVGHNLRPGRLDLVQ